MLDAIPISPDNIAVVNGAPPPPNSVGIVAPTYPESLTVLYSFLYTSGVWTSGPSAPSGTNFKPSRSPILLVSTTSCSLSLPISPTTLISVSASYSLNRSILPIVLL